MKPLSAPLRRRLKVAAVVAAAVIVVYGVVAWFALPALARWGVETVAARELDRKITLEDVSVNPYTLRVTLRGLAVAGAAGETEPMLAAREATVSAAWSSLVWFAPVIDALRIDGLRAHIVRTAPQRFNFSDIVDRFLAKPSTSDEPARFAVHNIELNDGEIHFDDRVRARTDVLSAIRLGVPYVSSLPIDADIKVQPAFAARLNDDPLELKGELLPFEAGMDTVLRLKLDGQDLPNLLSFSPIPLDFSVPHGALDADLSLTFRRATPALDKEPAHPAVLALAGTVALRDFALAAPAAKPAPLLEFKRLAVDIGELGIFARRVALRSVELDAPALEFRRDADGSNWQRFAAHPVGTAPAAQSGAGVDTKPTADTQAAPGTKPGAPPTPAAKPAPKPAAPAAAPWAVSVDRLRIADGGVHLVDATVGGAERRLAGLALDAQGLSTARGKRATVRASAHTPEREGLGVAGSLQLEPLAGELRLALKDVALDAAAPYLKAALDGSLAGRADASALLSFAQQPDAFALGLDDLALAARALRLRGPAEAGAELDLAGLALAGGKVDLGAHSVALGRLTLDAPRANVRRLADGRIGWTLLAREAVPAGAGTPAASPAWRGTHANAAASAPAPAPAHARADVPSASASAPAPADAAASPAWTVRLAEAQLKNGEVVYEDLATQPAAKLRATGIEASASNIAPGSAEHSPVSLRARLAKGGIATDGWFSLAPVAAQLRIDARRLDLALLQPYVAQHANALLASAEASSRGSFTLNLPAQGAPRIGYTGNARLANLHLLDAAGENDLLRWQALDIDKLALRSDETLALDIGQVKLAEFYARAIVSPQGKLNLAELAKRAPEEPAQTAAAPAITPPTTETARAVAPASGPTPAAAPTANPPTTAPAADANANANAARPLIRIAGITLVNGNVNFTDNFVQPNYTANLTGVNGTVSALASDAPAPADVKVDARVNGDAPVNIAGTLNPLAPQLVLDIVATAHAVDLPSFTPYSAKYAGYPITKGKLSLDLKYKVADGKLAAENHLFLDQLTFGDHIDSPTATKLPVLLAVALLKNSRGEIDINLPIEGTLDDPQFSVGGIIVRVFVNLIVKAVTSPFALLSSLFGGGEELGHVDFAAGSATLDTAQFARIDKLATALADRPGLSLDVSGRADAGRDTEGIRQARLEAKLRAAKVRELVNAGGSADPERVQIAAAERDALIAQVYADEKIPNKPRNAIGFAKRIPAPEMEKLIRENVAVAPDDLRALANQRASAVIARLTQEGRIASERVFLVEPKLDASDLEGESATRVDFGLK